MLKRDDRILECYLMQGQGLKWLGVVYLEGDRTPMALLRYPVSGTEGILRFLAGATREGVSETLSGLFNELAAREGLSAIQIVYPRGVAEKEFIEELREAKRSREAQRSLLEN